MKTKDHRSDRRELLKAGAAAAAGTLLTAPASAQTQSSSGRVDVQFHFAPKFYTDIVKKSGSFITTDRWGEQAALDYMGANKIGAGVMSVSTPGVDFLPTAESVAMARKLNDAATQVARDHRGRFGNFATLPMRDVDATLAEIAYAYDVLKMDGVCMMSNVTGLYLGNPKFALVFDELQRRKAIVFIHPTDPVYMGRLGMSTVAEWPFDTCRAAIDLMYSGTTKRCPDVRFILAHAGGALPMVCRRVEEMAPANTVQKSPTDMDDTIQHIANFYYDLAISAHENAIGALRGASSLSNVLFACDWPFAPDRAVEMNVKGFESLRLTKAERFAIERGNAAKLFPKLVQG